MTDEAFEELLDRVQLLEDEDQGVDDDGESEREELRRRQFALAVDRAVKKVVTKRDGRLSYTQTLKRHGCRLHFVRSGGRIHLIACLALDAEAVHAAEADYST